MANSEGKFFLGVVFGALAGAAAGLLLAPQSGKETREVLGKKVKEYTKDCKEMVEKGKEIAKEKIKDTADLVAKKMS
ncbi:MAG: YtxH domain-containing protein [Candidatus Berkelbacteria bacterium]|nr:YtxH domain-containing protein [Candidatus Berkelbacteria bacterium]